MTIDNTRDRSKRDPFGMFLEMAANPHGAIEAQEARGQAQLVASTQLPAQGDWDKLEALGFVKGAPTPGDDLFVEATLPDGWTKERTDHSMWSVIKDTRGIERVSVGYKAAFYDRWAQISVKDVGYSVSSDIIYGDNPVALPEFWSLLTEEERAGAIEGFTSYIEETREHVERYGDRENEDGTPYYGMRIQRAEEALKLAEASRG